MKKLSKKKEQRVIDDLGSVEMDLVMIAVFAIGAAFLLYKARKRLGLLEKPKGKK